EADLRPPDPGREGVPARGPGPAGRAEAPRGGRDRAPCGEGGDVPYGAGAVAGRGPRNRPRAGAPTRSERSVGFHHFGPPRSPGRPACCAYRRWHRNGRRTACRATTTSTPHAAGAAIAG